MKSWYIFPPDTKDTCVAQHDKAGWTLTAHAATHPTNGVVCQAFDVPDGTPDGNGCSLQVTDANGKARYKKSIHGVLYLNLPTGVGLIVDILPEVSGSGASDGPRTNVQLVGRSWQDSAGKFFPLGETMFYSVGHMKRDKQDILQQNYRYLKSHGVDCVRVLGQVDWAGQEIDPFWQDYPQLLAQTLELAYANGLLTEFTAIGGKCRDPLAAAKIMMSVIMDGRRHMVILGEATNEDKALDTNTAIEVAKILAPLGAFGIGMGNTAIEDNIIPGGSRAGGSLDFLHTEREQPEGRQVRQCWNFHLFARASVNGEPPGTGSSVGQMHEPLSHATLRAGSAICGAAMYVHHCGSGVTGNDEANSNGQRYALLERSPRHAEQLDACVNGVKSLPDDICSWPTRFNSNHPVEVAGGNVEKIYGATDGNRFAELVIDAKDGSGNVNPGATVNLRAQWTCLLRIVNCATNSLVWEGQLNAGQSIPVSGLQHYLLVGKRA